MEITSERQRAMLAAALGGDDEGFRGLVEPYRGELLAHCYRMLGSLHDAEDALQETLTRAWRGLRTFDAARPLRPWLYRIATNACLDAISRRPKRVLPMDYGRSPNPSDDEVVEPLAESLWIEPYPDDRLGTDVGYAAPEARYEQREAVELAFIAALQHLPANQRAVLILREVLGFSAQEVSEALDATVASVNSALQRARKSVDDRLPRQSQQANLRSLGDDRMRSLVKGYVAAWEAGDVDALVAMLAEDVTMAMPPYPAWWRGRDVFVAALLHPDSPFHERWKYLPTRANGQLAFAGYLWDADRGCFAPNALEVITLDGATVTAITGFQNPRLMRAFGLPDELPARGSS
jgi:RNA polymerase sigma-70 factor (ECF subfamily)